MSKAREMLDNLPPKSAAKVVRLVAERLALDALKKRGMPKNDSFKAPKGAEQIGLPRADKEEGE